jgi:hypothetical protein
MKALVVEAAGSSEGRRRVRQVRFEERSSLPVSAACVVASGVRERLAALFGRQVSLRLFEPAIPTTRAWASISDGAIVYRLRGGAADAAIVLRARDARLLAAAAFGEDGTIAAESTCLSPIEREVLDRTVAAIAGTLAPVCGSFDTPVPERIATVDGFVTYFELLLETPLESRIGVALSRDPQSTPQGSIDVNGLGEVALAAVVLVEVGAVEAGVMAGLAPGTFLPITRSGAIRGSLQIGGRTLAQGVCGAYRGRYALEIEG